MAKRGKKWYREIRQHPKWMKLRMKIWERANSSCEHEGCTYNYDEKNPLDVHHIGYEKGKMPWEYPLDKFELLCRKHHSERHRHSNLKVGNSDKYKSCGNCGRKMKAVTRDEYFSRWIELTSNDYRSDADFGWHEDANGEWYEIKDERPVSEQIDLSDLNDSPVDNGPPYFVCCGVFGSGSSNKDSTIIEKQNPSSIQKKNILNVTQISKVNSFRPDSKDCISTNIERGQPSDQWKEKHLSKKSYRESNEDIWGNIPVGDDKLQSESCNRPPEVPQKYKRDDTNKGI